MKIKKLLYKKWLRGSDAQQAAWLISESHWKLPLWCVYFDNMTPQKFKKGSKTRSECG